MYYSSGNYEAFAHPKKPEGVDHKSAYIIVQGWQHFQPHVTLSVMVR